MFMKQVQRSNPLRYILGTEGTSVSRTGKAPASWSPVLAGDTDKEKEREEKKRRGRIGRREIKRFRIEMKSAGKIGRRSVRRALPEILIVLRAEWQQPSRGPRSSEQFGERDEQMPVPWGGHTWAC